MSSHAGFRSFPSLFYLFRNMARPSPPRAAEFLNDSWVTSSTPVFGNVSFASPAAGAGAGLFSPCAALGAAATCVVGAAGVAGVVVLQVLLE